MLNFTNKIGKTINELAEGQSISMTETIEDQQLLLYLGLTNDANPLFIQHDFSRHTEYERPIVPTVMLMGIISSTVSKHLPGPGSNIVNFSFNLVQPIYHYETLTFHFEVIKVDKMKDVVTISIEAHNYNEQRVLDSVVMVRPPQLIEEEVTEFNE
nr:MaoC/PaaZ C-terminal domain-containing protein [Vagococcus vulneris]